MGHHHHLEFIRSPSPPGSISDSRRTESSFEEIPVIDFDGLESLKPSLRRALSDKIRDACINVGFFYVKNHGISEDIIRGAVEAGKKLFALPTSTKMDLDIHRSANYKGYTALFGEKTDPDGKGDLHEGLDLGWELDAPESPENGGYGAMTGGNVWPPGIVDRDFRSPVLRYYHAAVALGQRLFPLFALALDLPEDYFVDKEHYQTSGHYAFAALSATERHDNYGRWFRYRHRRPHRCFTILWQDDVGGLQVQNMSGKWIDAVPIPGTLVLNLGDQFARWTNDVFKSTLHRAINKSGAERYSMPLFFGTDYDILLEPIPGCTSPSNPFKYEVVTAGEYVKSRLEATYAHSAPPS